MKPMPRCSSRVSQYPLLEPIGGQLPFPLPYSYLDNYTKTVAERNGTKGKLTMLSVENLRHHYPDSDVEVMKFKAAGLDI